MEGHVPRDGLSGCCRMTIRYTTAAQVDDAGLGQRMMAIAEVRRRFGYRRLHVLREGYLVNHKKLFRLYQREKLAVRRRPGRKRAIGTRAPMRVPRAPNERGSLDFAQDQLTGPPLPYPDRGRRLHPRVPSAGG
jgi:putative transposase